MAEEGQLAIELSQRIAKKPSALSSALRCVRFICSVGSVAEHFFRTEETAVRFGYGTPVCTHAPLSIDGDACGEDGSIPSGVCVVADRNHTNAGVVQGG